MRKHCATMLFAALAGALASGCSGAGPTNPNTQSIGAPPFAGRPASVFPKSFKGLYVSDFGIDGVRLLAAPKYDTIADLTKGMYGPAGLWVDPAGNLYVANADGKNVTEYAPGKQRPKCAYTGTTDPTDVKTNRMDEVFVMDWGEPNFDGAIDVYKQCQNTIVRKYAFGAGSISERPDDVAFDSAGNMFVIYLRAMHDGHEAGRLEEFEGHSMTPKQLGASVSFPGGLLIDKHQRLIAANQGNQGEDNGSIVTIAPPYSIAKTLVAGLDQPVFLSLDRTGRLLFVSSFDLTTPTVWIFDYPSGKLKATLGAANGLQTPRGVAASPAYAQ
jgi:DNA-binding beta-propeller fold protein YncE